MTKVVIKVAAHEVEVVADETLDEVASVAAGLYEATAVEARALVLGFEGANLNLERALAYVEPGTEAGPA